MIRTQVYLPKDLYQDLRLIARREKKATAQVLRETLKRAIESKRQKTAGDALFELAKLGKKLKIKAPKDLSANHDKYLYEE